MTIQHINTLLALAERARQAGLIQFDEMPIVVEAVQAGREALKQAEQPAQQAAETPGESEAGRGKK